ncbi:ornithine cyclodeaminase family protein [Zhaonella formicivorans]|uniref:ornithine cyclodeaminase family protein n=1 Tax=Zhaonella formicivorans TaxID=2528593 RepID=UPI0010F16B67|nr:ornithine cyclodeaminase family protein [Zhaonella formicivorans]
MMNEAIIMTQADVKKYVSIKDIIDIVEQTYVWYAQNEIIMPSKITLNMHELGLPNWINSMPSYVRPLDTLGIKWAGGFIGNKKLGLPYIMAEILLNDPLTGQLRALVDGNWITDIRTGAQTAVAAKYLAVNPEVLAIIGAGVQGISTALCMLETFELKEIRVADISADACEKFAREIGQKTSVPVKVCKTNEEAVKDADVIVTVTTADEALVKAEWVKPGAFVSSKGSYQELDENLIFKADKLYVDHLEQNLHRGEFLKYFLEGRLKKEDIVGEIGEVICGKVIGRKDKDERIVASLIGMGCLDIAIAAVVYRKMTSIVVPDYKKFKLA